MDTLDALYKDKTDSEIRGIWISDPKISKEEYDELVNELRQKYARIAQKDAIPGHDETFTQFCRQTRTKINTAEFIRKVECIKDFNRCPSTRIRWSEIPKHGLAKLYEAARGTGDQHLTPAEIKQYSRTLRKEDVVKMYGEGAYAPKGPIIPPPEYGSFRDSGDYKWTNLLDTKAASCVPGFTTDEAEIIRFKCFHAHKSCYKGTKPQSIHFNNKMPGIAVHLLNKPTRHTNCKGVTVHALHTYNIHTILRYVNHTFPDMTLGELLSCIWFEAHSDYAKTNGKPKTRFRILYHIRHYEEYDEQQQANRERHDVHVNGIQASNGWSKGANLEGAPDLSQIFPTFGLTRPKMSRW